MNKSRDLFSEILQETVLEYDAYHAQRHYRLWKKRTQGAYQSMSDKEMCSSIKTYISQSLPLENAMQICSETLCQFNIDYSITLHKQLHALGIDIEDTLKGYYIKADDLILIQSYINEYTSLLEVFYRKTSIRNEYDNRYRDFLKRCKHKMIDLISIPFHPSAGKLFFHRSLTDAVNQTLMEWIACNEGNNSIVPEGCLSLSESAELLSIDIYTMFEFANNHKEYIELVSDYIYPLKKSVERWRSDLNESRPLSRLIDSIRKEFKYIGKEQAVEAVQQLIAEDGLTCTYTGQKLAGKNKDEWFYNVSDESEVGDVIRRCLNNLSVFPISILIPITGYSEEELTRLVTKDLIIADESDGGYLVSRNEIIRIEKFRDNLIPLEDVITQILKDTDSMFGFNLAKCREDLYSFIELNDFWTIEFLLADEIPIKAGKSRYFIKQTDELNLRHRLILWIEAYGVPNSEKIEILLRYHENLYPRTCQALTVYFSGSNNSGCTLDDKAVLDMISTLLPMLGSELIEMSEDEIQDIIEQFRECTITSSQCLANFLFDSCYTVKRYEFDKTGISMDTSAYPIKEFALMAYSVLNNESWEENKLISKAVHNKRYAALWTFIALHFFASWRSTDFERLQAPALQYSAEETLKQIEEGTYKEEDAKIVALRFRYQIDLSSLKPNKTSKYQNIPELHFFCPQSCEYPLGIILSIATAHFELNMKESQFVRCINDVRTIRDFFGTEFLDACNKRQFSTRRANKSLMQSVETVSESGEKKGLPRPYILASLMRSHKGGYGSLAESTAIYLRDANFSGFTPEFIAEQMFERGVCSFVANELMKISFGTEYQRLSVPAQTQMIKTIGLPAGEIEKIVRACQKAEDEANDLVRDLLGNEDYKEKAGDFLKSILMGEAAGKDFGSICVLRASGHKCVEPSRPGCLGCIYEIKTKALLLHYLKEYSRISKELEDKSIKSNKIEVERRRYIINNVIYHAIEEILITLEGRITSYELMEYKNIVEEALRYGD
jgi:hypothetical protein